MWSFVNEIPITSKAVSTYNTHTFSNLYYDKESEMLYLMITESQYRVCLKHNKKGCICFIISDTNHKPTNLAVSKLNKLFN